LNSINLNEKSKAMYPTIIKAATLIFFVLFSLTLAAQNTPVTAKNTTYAEFRVAGLKEVLYSASVNYERHIFKQGPVLSNTLRVGVGAWTAYASAGIEFISTLQFLIGRKEHKIEIQGGYAYLTGGITHAFAGVDPSVKYGIPVFNAGYRYQKPEGGFVFRFFGGTWGYINIAFGYSF